MAGFEKIGKNKKAKFACLLLSGVPSFKYNQKQANIYSNLRDKQSFVLVRLPFVFKDLFKTLCF
jgi:hypothetical protein